MKCQAIVPAAGMGTRLGCDGPKALIDLCGKPLLIRTLDALLSTEDLRRAVAAVPADWRRAFEDALDSFGYGGKVRVVDGGAERQDSVRLALQALDDDAEIAAIHDAARPFVRSETIVETLNAARECGAATAAVRCSDTILEVNENYELISTPDRRRMWSCQTPQAFRVEVIREAHARAQAEGWTMTDDASLVRRVGRTVKIVEGGPDNFKITTETDLDLAKSIVNQRAACSGSV